MAKHLMLAMTNPLPGREAEYNRWYDEVAYPIYKSLPGLAPLGRFKAVDVPAMFSFQMDNKFQYLSLYTFETEDPVAFVEQIGMTLHSRDDYYFSETRAVFAGLSMCRSTKSISNRLIAMSG